MHTLARALAYRERDILERLLRRQPRAACHRHEKRRGNGD
jgi:hypothetical protein